MFLGQMCLWRNQVVFRKLLFTLYILATYDIDLTILEYLTMQCWSAYKTWYFWEDCASRKAVYIQMNLPLWMCIMTTCCKQENVYCHLSGLPTKYQPLGGRFWQQIPLLFPTSASGICKVALSHTVHDREIWGVCKGAGMQICAPGMRACSIQFPSYLPSSPRFLYR